MTRRLTGDGSHETRVTDFIDPEFERVDDGVVGRAAEVRKVADEVKAGSFKVLRDLNTIHTKRNGVYIDECKI